MIIIRVLELKIRVKLGLNEFLVKRLYIYNAFRVYLYIGHHKKIYNFI